MFGPGDYLDITRAHAFGALIYRFVRASKERASRVDLWGSPDILRQWCYVDRASEIICDSLCLESRGQPTSNVMVESVNVNEGVVLTMGELAASIAKECDFRGEVSFGSTARREC